MKNEAGAYEVLLEGLPSHPLSKTVALVALRAAAAFAANLSGKWSGSFPCPGCRPRCLKQDGSKLTGSGGSNHGEQYPIENARIDGNNLTFDLTTGDWKFTYRLKVSSRQLEGDLELKSVDNKRTAKVILNKVILNKVD